MLIAGLAVLLLLGSPTSAQFPTEPSYDRIFDGKFGAGYQVSIKENSICETTPGVKSYSGYITTPPTRYSSTTANSFYWFFESRNDPSNAPFVLFIGGGPGFSSIASVVNDLGPCIVNADSNSTSLNPWSFNNDANILFIDQPDMVGYSYDTKVNASMEFAPPGPGGLGQGLPIVPETATPLPLANDTIGLGTFGSQNPNNTANTTSNAAQIYWADVQTWFQAFPQYLPKDSKISLWTESYGGRYGPEFARLFPEKNKQIASGGICEAQILHFDTLGLINGWLDPVLHLLSYPAFAVNNTYGVQMINSTVLSAMQSNLTAPGGCLELVSQCQTIAAASDPLNTGSNSTVNELCALALQKCTLGVQTPPLESSGLQVDDIAQPIPGSWVPPYLTGFFAQSWVQQALGAAVNWTENSTPISAAFFGTGDIVMGTQLEHLGALLDEGVNVAIVNGDRDYQINWFGGEAASLALNWADADAFRDAGYANITTNETYVGGLVRQAGRLSFSRVFQAGHQGPTYQPETYYRIFERAMKRLNVPDGKMSMERGNGTSLATVGPREVFDVRQTALPPKEPVCYQLSASMSCTAEQLQVIGTGKAAFKDFVLQE